MKKATVILTYFILFISCNSSEQQLTFKETGISMDEDASIEINYPKATGSDNLSKKFNSTIETAIATELSFSEELKDNDINDAINTFSKEYKIFKNDLPESNQIWEAQVDGEVVYQSPEIISVSLSTYIDTGGAHGNTHVIFLNIDPNTGEEISREDLIKDEEAFKTLAASHFKNHLENKKRDLDVVDSFYGKDFQLPETIGLSDEGIIILYNTYEIAAYDFGITEFVIPFDEGSKFISRH